MRTISILAALVFLAVVAASATPPAAPEAASRSRQVIPDDVVEAVTTHGTARVFIVTNGNDGLPERATRKDIDRLASKMESLNEAFGKKARSAGASVLHQFRYTPGISAEIDLKALEKLRQMPEVQAVYLDRPVQLHLEEGVSLIGATVLHPLGHTGSGQRAAIIDSGVDWTEPALGGCAAPGPGCKVAAAVSFCELNTDPMDYNGHGTAVAGIVAANLGTMKGVAPDADIVALKAFHEDCIFSFDYVRMALEWVVTNGFEYNIKVVNMSLGDTGQYGSGNPFCSSDPVTGNPLAVLIRTLVTNMNIAVTVSSGNEGHDLGIAFPACVPEATSVAAVYDKTGISISPGTSCGDTSPVSADQFICWASAGGDLDLLAPSWRCDTVGWPGFSGTSAAAPYVAGGFLVMNSMASGNTPTVIEQKMKAHGKPVVHPTNGLTYPRLDLKATSLEYDADGDGIQGLVDNCPFVPNPNQNFVGAPVVNVTAPNGGQSFKIGNSVSLQWTASDDCGGVSSVDLLLSRNGVNGSYELLFGGIPNSGSQSWTVTGPSTSGFTAFLKAVARDPGNNTGQDTSNAGFKIRCGVCVASYCGNFNERCTWNSTCGVDGCCSYSCTWDPTCPEPTSPPWNACDA